MNFSDNNDVNQESAKDIFKELEQMDEFAVATQDKKATANMISLIGQLNSEQVVSYLRDNFKATNPQQYRKLMTIFKWYLAYKPKELSIIEKLKEVLQPEEFYRLLENINVTMINSYMYNPEITIENKLRLLKFYIENTKGAVANFVQFFINPTGYPTQLGALQESIKLIDNIALRNEVSSDVAELVALGETWKNKFGEHKKLPMDGSFAAREEALRVIRESLNEKSRALFLKLAPYLIDDKPFAEELARKAPSGKTALSFFLQ